MGKTDHLFKGILNKFNRQIEIYDKILNVILKFSDKNYVVSNATKKNLVNKL